MLVIQGAITAWLSLGVAVARAGDPAGVVVEVKPKDEFSPVDVTVANDSELRYWRMPLRITAFPDRPVFDYVEQVNRLTLGLSKGKHNLWFQLDEVALLANRYRLDGVLYVERDLRSAQLQSFLPTDTYANLEKIRYGYTGESATLTLGDNYTVFTRGMALNLNRNVDIDIDSSLRGVKAEFQRGDWTVIGVAGTVNRQQVFQDNPNLGLRPDIHHGVAGMRVEKFGLGPANVGAHGVVYDFVGAAGNAGWGELGTPDAIIAGGNVEAFGVLGLDTYLEADAFLYPSNLLFGGEEARPGYAVYGSASAYVGSTTWLFEAKRYRDTEHVNALVTSELYRVAVPPTLEYERVITEDSAAATSSNDIAGARLRCDWSVIPVHFVPYAAIGVYRDRDTAGLHFNEVSETIVHPVIGVEAPGSRFTLLANTGVRFDDRDEKAFSADRQIHADVDAKWALAGPYSAAMSFAVEQFRWGVNPLQQSDYVEVESSVSLLRGSRYVVNWYTDYSSNPLVNTVGNLSERVYGAMEFQYKPTTSLTVKAFYGSYKAGIRCAGGQCRRLPGFDGARVSVTGQF